VEFVADESCSGPVIRALRAAGHEVISIAESSKGTADEAVIERAFDERRVLITEDRDLANWSTRGRQSAGVIFLKFPSRVRCAKPAAVVEGRGKNWRQVATSLHCRRTGTDSRRAKTAGRKFSPDRALSLLELLIPVQNRSFLIRERLLWHIRHHREGRA